MTLVDYGVPTTEPLPGESLSSGAYLRWYSKRVQRLAVHVGIHLFFAKWLELTIS